MVQWSVTIIVRLLEPFAVAFMFMKPFQKVIIVQRRPLVEERYALLVSILKRTKWGVGDINNLIGAHH